MDNTKNLVKILVWEQSWMSTAKDWPQTSTVHGKIAMISLDFSIDFG